jgi:hypothetical protein
MFQIAHSQLPLSLFQFPVSKPLSRRSEECSLVQSRGDAVGNFKVHGETVHSYPTMFPGKILHLLIKFPLKIN